MKEHLNKQIAAVGMELSNGQWIMYQDGSLCFEGSGTLIGGAFRAHRQKIRRIEVSGFDTIAARQFENLPMLEEVLLSDSVTRIEAEAFYGCKKLAAVIMGKNVVIGMGAFALTAWGMQGTEASLNRLTDTSAGQQFVEVLDCCLETLEKPFESNQQLKPIIEKLEEGAHARDPVLMYLWAEFLLWGDVIAHESIPCKETAMCAPFLEIDLAFPGFESYSWMELYEGSVDNGPFVWYQRAAEAGYLPAMCWLGWCLKYGIGCQQDEAAAQEWLRRADAASPTDSLEVEELNCFPECAAHLASLARDASLEEDEVADFYGSQNLSAPPDAYPDPDWRSLHVESIGVYNLGCMFGVVDCVFRADLSYDYYDDERSTDFVRFWMGTEKRV